MAGCTVKHIEIPIPDDEWACPACGAKNDLFYIDSSSSDDLECELYHAGDAVNCDQCGGGWKLSTVIKKWATKKNMIQCTHCKGTGVIPKS
jgi:hypothetical protein